MVTSLDKKKKQEIIRTSLQRQADRVDAKTKTMVDAVMDPLKSYFSPLENMLTNSEVDNGSKHLCSSESWGIKTWLYRQKTSGQIQGRNKDGHYHVELPWHQEKVNAVPSNHNVALKVLDRTRPTKK